MNFVSKHTKLFFIISLFSISSSTSQAIKYTNENVTGTFNYAATKYKLFYNKTSPLYLNEYDPKVAKSLLRPFQESFDQFYKVISSSKDGFKDAMALVEKLKSNIQKLQSSKWYWKEISEIRVQIDKDLWALAIKLHQPY